MSIKKFFLNYHSVYLTKSYRPIFYNGLDTGWVECELSKVGEDKARKPGNKEDMFENVIRDYKIGV